MGDIVIRHSAKPHLLHVNRQTYLSTLEMRLYKNAIDPDPAAGTGQFVEVTDSGYVPQVADFMSPFLNAANCGQMDGAASLSNTMAHDAGDYTVHGVYWTDPADGDEWVYAQRADVAIPIIAPGQVVVVLPRYQNEAGACP